MEYIFNFNYSRKEFVLTTTGALIPIDSTLIFCYHRTLHAYKPDIMYDYFVSQRTQPEHSGNMNHTVNNIIPN